MKECGREAALLALKREARWRKEWLRAGAQAGGREGRRPEAYVPAGLPEAGRGAGRWLTFLPGCRRLAFLQFEPDDEFT